MIMIEETDVPMPLQRIIDDYYLEDVKHLKELYDRKYANKYVFEPSDVVSKSLLAERIMQSQEYIIKKLLAAIMTINTEDK